MALHRSQAIVIGGHNLAEADRIIPFYTQELGLVRAVAEGARRIRSRFAGSLELFTHGHLVFFERPNRGLHKVNEFGVIHSFPALREDLDRLATAACVAELVAASVAEGDPNPDLFAALLRALDLLDGGARPNLVLRAFEVKALKLGGFLPELYTCMRCRQAIAGGVGAALSPHLGGLVCLDCLGALPAAHALSAPAIAFLRAAARLEIQTAAQADLPPGTAEELARCLGQYLPHVLGRSLRSAAFLDRL